MTTLTEASPDTATSPTLRDMANAIRALTMDAVERARSGHPGMPLGMADAATALFTRVMRFDAAGPSWPDRDRFVLSAGHGSMLLYAALHLLGYPDIDMGQLRAFRQIGSRTAGHPEFGHAAGIETTTGPLGQGLATAVGMAIAEAHLRARFGPELMGHHTYVMAGDGCLMEGISHEAIDLAGHLKLGRLIVLWDDNGISIDGPTSLSTSTDQRARFAAAGWRVLDVDGLDGEAATAALLAAKADDSAPCLIACRTIIGFGAPTRAGTRKAHSDPMGEAEIAGARAALGWEAAPFEIPAPILQAWRAAGARGAAARLAWSARLAASEHREAFEAAMTGTAPPEVFARLEALGARFAAERPKIATRKASETALAEINAATDLTLGGSADLTPSNLTQTPGLAVISPDDVAGRYLHYGVREHGMAAAMNGLALHGGVIPYGGTFLVFTDYARGAIRLSALMGVRVIYVMTHDSIGVGEDGPTHQPIEHLAMLRATPNLEVWRPADPVETAEAWACALASRTTPSVLALSRQAVATLRTEGGSENLSARGAYVLAEPSGGRQATILATGSEVELAMAAADRLGQQGVRAAVVSMPCWERFEAQDDAYRAAVLGEAPRVAVEAAARLGWDRWIGERGAFVGMTGFGASGPAPQAYAHFGITADAVAEAALRLIGG